MRALKVVSKGEAAVQTVPIPALRPDYILVKTSHVALNPTDWKHVDFLPNPGATIGCDYSGKVVDVGPEVKAKFDRGDRIAGFVHGVNAMQKEDGAFGEYLVAKGDVQMKTPDNLTDAEAATLGVGVSTVAQGMYQSLQLPWPEKGLKEKIPLLIYGGSTATGALAIQYAKL
jgi:NADPH:quinone reductase-like Zn-dependent oxidoreductase